MPIEIFSSPQIARVGFTEQVITEAGIDYMKFSNPASKQTKAGNRGQGRVYQVPLWTRRTGRFLGATFLGQTHPF
jgi:pyruvate/2-oxoglutarate dehydrogenase complex dihydrolipoamide dehydrogenase (E3) component